MYWCSDLLMYWCIDVLMYWCMYVCMYVCRYVCITIGNSIRPSPSEDATCPGTKEKFCSNSVPTILAGNPCRGLATKKKSSPKMAQIWNLQRGNQPTNQKPTTSCWWLTFSPESSRPEDVGILLHGADRVEVPLAHLASAAKQCGSRLAKTPREKFAGSFLWAIMVI